VKDRDSALGPVDNLEDLLDAHGLWLAQGDVGRAAVTAQAAADRGLTDARELMSVAGHARGALAPVAPAAEFRERLHDDLVAAARARRNLALAAPRRRSAAIAGWLRRQPARRLLRGGAAVAVIGLAAAVVWLERSERGAVGAASNV